MWVVMAHTTNGCWILDELEKARAYSRALRHMMNAGLREFEPLTYDDELCKWDGPLLPLEPFDRWNYVPEHQVVHGTERGYQWHRKRNEDACEPCKEAKRNGTRTGRAKVRKTA